MLHKILVSVAAAVAPIALSAGVAIAVPCSPVTCAPLSVAPAGSNVLLLRPLGLHGSLQAFDLRTGKTAASLPGGVLSADGRRFVAAAPARNGARIVRYDAATGLRLGAWRVPGAGARLGAVSANGRYAALVRGDESSRISVVDLVRRVVLRTIEPSGPWQVDALSADGTRLYLLQYLPDGTYRVRVDIAGRGLSRRAITDPNDPEPMNGLPWSSVGTRDGRQQLTLFVKSTGDETEAFIHALSLDRSAAACIDLPSADLMANGRYALVLSPTVAPCTPPILRSASLPRSIWRGARLLPSRGFSPPAPTSRGAGRSGRSRLTAARCTSQPVTTCSPTTPAAERCGRRIRWGRSSASVSPPAARRCSSYARTRRFCG